MVASSDDDALSDEQTIWTLKPGNVLMPILQETDGSLHNLQSYLGPQDDVGVSTDVMSY